jgi:IPT/TIG domain
MMNTRFIMSIIALLLLAAGMAFALIPHTPVNQDMGTFDTLSSKLTEATCRRCHASGVPDTHHNLEAKYQCMNCHPVITNPDLSQAITMVRDCMQCHNAAFNNLNIRKPHHETQNAQDGHCSSCHGNIVDDYDDGHYIPIYNISLVTPATKYREINSTTGKKSGGCESCHERNRTLDPLIYSNKKTHHNLGSVSGFNPSNISKCAACHDLQSGQYESGSIRYCERCHGITSLHNIQYNYTGTNGQPGYGHIGARGDCNGCHALYMASEAMPAPGTDVIIPVINNISTSKVTEGNTTMLIIHGSNLVTTVDGVTHSSVVVLTDEINPITLTPTAANSTDIVVTLPALSKGDYGVYALKNGSVKSNRLPLVVISKVVISSAVNVDNKVTISGSGFGHKYDPLYNNWINVTISYDKRGTVAYRSIEITHWSDTLINLNSADAIAGDIVTVNSINGTNSTEIMR